MIYYDGSERVSSDVADMMTAGRQKETPDSFLRRNARLSFSLLLTYSSDFLNYLGLI